ncbi:RNA polymerase II transcription mediator complex subunit 9-domain-containing protein [Xylariaceae sp. FL0016]|nr:RNA polymerase II transcription mediator complex subunit 9-domain-containing protein [Xylariaceae sp. FL0016]
MPPAKPALTVLDPDTLDVLTDLSGLLKRLRAPPSTTFGGTNATSTAANTSTTHPPPPGATPNPTPATPSAQSGAKRPELSLKDVPAASDGLKHRFQRARTQILALPDLDRGLGEQEAEIQELERKIERQRVVLMQLREVGARFAAGEGEADVDRMVE